MAHGRLRRNSAHRRAMLRNITTSLLDKECIETTAPKAKELKSIAEKMITLGKRGDLHARRQALAYIQDEDVVTPKCLPFSRNVIKTDPAVTPVPSNSAFARAMLRKW